jgi:hypothetical protein
MKSPQTTPDQPEDGDRLRYERLGLPNALARTVGQHWLERHGDIEDKAFVAACVFRLMHLAMNDPDAPEVRVFR